jgi:NAD-dependent SIR2 family protein deacetylase
MAKKKTNMAAVRCVMCDTQFRTERAGLAIGGNVTHRRCPSCKKIQPVFRVV